MRGKLGSSIPLNSSIYFKITDNKYYHGINLGASNQRLELLVTSVLDLGNDLCDLYKGTNVTGRDEATQNPFSVEIRPRRES